VWKSDIERSFSRNWKKFNSSDKESKKIPVRFKVRINNCRISTIEDETN
jgi:hypothetical protein